MEYRATGLDGVVEIIPNRISDERGYFAETYSHEKFLKAGIDLEWVQDNQSLSVRKGVLRGLHFQVAPFAQDKLIRVLRGAIFDVAVDIRGGSPSFGKWVSCVLSAEAFNQLLVPKGFAHGFLTLEANTEVLYKVSAPYAPACDRAIRHDDPALAINWPLPAHELTLSLKDRNAPFLSEFTGRIAF